MPFGTEIPDAKKPQRTTCEVCPLKKEAAELPSPPMMGWTGWLLLLAFT
jgi:hypothetical protein